MKVKVKICGIRTLEAALNAVGADADFLGFNFVISSKRYISPENAKKIIDQVKGQVSIVGVFQNAPFVEVNTIAEELKLDLVQLHGKEDNEYIQKIKRPVIKSFTIFDNPENIQAKYVMLDRIIQGKGEMVDLEKAAVLAKNFPLFLAGGLTPENVKEIVKRVRPCAVDVAGGVDTNEKQDIKKIRKFIERAKI